MLTVMEFMRSMLQPSCTAPCMVPEMSMMTSEMRSTRMWLVMVLSSVPGAPPWSEKT